MIESSCKFWLIACTRIGLQRPWHCANQLNPTAFWQSALKLLRIGDEAVAAAMRWWIRVHGTGLIIQSAIAQVHHLACFLGESRLYTCSAKCASQTIPVWWICARSQTDILNWLIDINIDRVNSEYGIIDRGSAQRLGANLECLNHVSSFSSTLRNMAWRLKGPKARAYVTF